MKQNKIISQLVSYLFLLLIHLNPFLPRIQKMVQFHETSYTLPKERGKNIHEIFFVSSVVSEIWCMFIWTMPAETGTKLAKIRLKINTLSEWIWFPQGKLLHWWTGRYLMNWIQVVYFILKEIWPLFSPAKAKKLSSFFTSLPPKHESMKPNLSQKVTKVNYFTEGIQVVYFKLKEIWLLFSNAKAKKPSSFFTSLDESMKANFSQKAMKLGPNDNTSLRNWIQVVHFKLKEIWPLFSPAKAKKPSAFFTSLPPKHESMKPNFS